MISFEIWSSSWIILSRPASNTVPAIQLCAIPAPVYRPPGASLIYDQIFTRPLGLTGSPEPRSQIRSMELIAALPARFRRTSARHVMAFIPFLGATLNAEHLTFRHILN
ncbi:MAG: hypothetical protein FIB08_14330 [Candidatus Methanoperedens sp.]|nr:hypothetical protein [Candidatus Methanoperedens sp.]